MSKCLLLIFSPFPVDRAGTTQPAKNPTVEHNVGARLSEFGQPLYEVLWLHSLSHLLQRKQKLLLFSCVFETTWSQKQLDKRSTSHCQLQLLLCSTAESCLKCYTFSLEVVLFSEVARRSTDLWYGRRSVDTAATKTAKQLVHDPFDSRGPSSMCTAHVKLLLLQMSVYLLDGNLAQRHTG